MKILQKEIAFSFYKTDRLRDSPNKNVPHSLTCLVLTHDDCEIWLFDFLLQRDLIRLELDPDRVEIRLDAAAAGQDVLGGDQGTGAEVGLRSQVEQPNHPRHGAGG